MYKRFLRPVFLTKIFYMASVVIVILAFISYFLVILRPYPMVLTLVLLLLLAADYLALFSNRTFEAERLSPDRLSNGDENKIEIRIRNPYPFPVDFEILDELPEQLQERDLRISERFDRQEQKTLHYFVKPLKRGEYKFGHLNIFAAGPMKLMTRRYVAGSEVSIPVFPSFLQMKNYSLMALSHSHAQFGIRKIRRIGHSMEYEQIQDYVPGDDIRTINWKASARKANLMVNKYTEEKAQQIYCLIDKGRAMKTPIEGMSLLDYAINSSLVLSSIALQNKDKAGLITFSDVPGVHIPADSRNSQLNLISNALHNEKSRFLESSYDMIFTLIRRKVTHRSLFVLFTHFDSISALQRQIPYLKKLNTYHLLLVVFFQDTELTSILEEPSASVKELYVKTIAAKFALEKKQVLKELQLAGIMSLISKPQNLTINAINKYLEIKHRNLI